MLTQDSGLNENGLHWLKYLDIWSPVGGTIWEGSGEMPLSEEVFKNVKL